MASLNRCEFIGHLGKDPEIRQTPQGKKVANFSLACSESWTDQSGQRHDNTEWVSIVAWDGLAGVAERFLKKGAQVYVSGKMQTRSWDDQATGKKVYKTEVQARELLMLGKRPEGQGQVGYQAPAGAGYQGPPPADDDLPFNGAV